jgi:hypothetical protein
MKTLIPLLRRQKLKKRKAWLRKPRLWFTAVAGLAILSALVWTVNAVQSLLRPGPHAAVIVELEAKSLSNPEAVEQRIVSAVRKELQASTPAPRILDRLIHRFHPEDARLVVLSPEQVFVRIKLRDPALSIKTPKWRFVSTKGEVFGDASTSKDRLRSLEGLELAQIMDRSGQLILDANQQRIMRDAVVLDRLLDENSLNYRQLRWIQHRGFQLVEQGELPAIMIGDKNLGERVKKARTLLLDYQKKSKSISSIEVDYNNKLFIKERTSL